MTDDRTKLIEKIRKIQRKAEGTTSAAEADTFLEKMSKMMAENSITMDELKEQDITVGFGYSDFNMNYSDSWRKQLAWASAKLCGCIGIYMRGSPKHAMRIYGRPENVEIAIDTYIYIHDQIRKICRSLYPNDRKSYIQAQSGICAGIQIKIANILKEMMDEAVSGAIDSKVPMIVESQVVADFVHRSTETKVMNMRPVKATAAAINGLNAADRVDVRKAVR